MEKFQEEVILIGLDIVMRSRPRLSTQMTCVMGNTCMYV